MSISPELTSGTMVPVPLCGCSRDCILAVSASAFESDAPSV